MKCMWFYARTIRNRLMKYANTFLISIKAIIRDLWKDIANPLGYTLGLAR